MKTLYIDCFSGVSGDMFLASLIDLGVPIDRIREELRNFPIRFDINTSRVQRSGITGTLLEVVDYESEQQHRRASDLISLVEESPLAAEVKKNTITALQAIARAEGIIHGVDPDSVHLHELSGIDTVVDIAGVFFALKFLGVENIICSPVPTGFGSVRTSHGTFPLPAPATLELLRGIPIYAGESKTEQTTPTGAALLKTICHSFGHIPQMTVENIGYGAGNRDLPTPNILRVFWGYEDRSDILQGNDVVLETNLDDMSPQVIGYLNERLFEEGARDVFTTSVLMKKQRPGILLTIISPPEKTKRLENIVFTETTTLGIRRYEVKKSYLPRSIKTVSTRWGTVRVKCSLAPTGFRYTPEYDDCRTLARNTHVPLQEIITEARLLAENNAGGKPPAEHRSVNG